MQKIANWMAGVEKDIDSEVLSFRNRKHTAVKLLSYSAGIMAIGIILGGMIF